MSADVDRSRIPEATAFKPADFPETHVTTLPNGLKMRHAQWPGGPLVVASLIVRGGASVDPQDKQGLARLTASLLTAGAGRMSEEQLTDTLARLDATLQATTDIDTVTLTLVAPKENMKEGARPSWHRGGHADISRRGGRAREEEADPGIAGCAEHAVVCFPVRPCAAFFTGPALPMPPKRADWGRRAG